MKYLLLILFSFTFISLSAQESYKTNIITFRNNYIKEHLADKRSPIKAADTAFLRFYPVNKNYRFVASVIVCHDCDSFEINTHSGKKKWYRKYATLHFSYKKKLLKLEVYQSLQLMRNQEYKNYLFVPFNDLTNYETTYAGGRYIDLQIDSIKNGKIVLDFNKAYNPYCAYAEGFSCPIPPVANRLKIKILAGEQLFAKKEN